MLKKIAVLTSIFVAVVVLSGCGKQEDSTSGVSQVDESQTETQEQAEGMEDGVMTRGDGQRGGRPQDGTGNRMNPLEATEACVDKIEGDVCQFTIVNEDEESNEIVGTCKVPMQRQQETAELAEGETVVDLEKLSCQPDRENMPGKGKGMIPAESNIAE